MTGAKLNLTGENSSAFVIAASNCERLEAAGKCSVSIGFRAPQPGSYSARLVVYIMAKTSTGPVTLAVDLSGNVSFNSANQGAQTAQRDNASPEYSKAGAQSSDQTKAQTPQVAAQTKADIPAPAKIQAPEATTKQPSAETPAQTKLQNSAQVSQPTRRTGEPIKSPRLKHPAAGCAGKTRLRSSLLWRLLRA